MWWALWFGCAPPPPPALPCGEGTIEQSGSCVVAWDPIICGPGTIEVDGECVIETTIVCGDGTILRGEECVDADDQWISAPFEAGALVYISQGHHGNFSHYGTSAYAVDFSVPEGTPIVAVRSGRVLALREDSNVGCGDVSCADDGNYVRLDHGDGTIANYWHLQQDGALVTEGESVPRGTVIGLSGNTGFSTGPHLHLEINDLYGQSLPIRFEELDDTDGVLYAGLELESENTLDTDVFIGEWSTCGETTFLHMGVSLEAPVEVPCSVATRDVAYRLSGWVGDPGETLMVAQWVSSEEAFDYTCHPVDSDGQVDIDLSWDPEVHSGQSWLMLATADPYCYSYQGWYASVHIRFDL